MARYLRATVAALVLLMALAAAYCPAAALYPTGLCEQECGVAACGADDIVCMALTVRAGARVTLRLALNTACALLLLPRILHLRQARLHMVRRQLLYFYVNCPKLAPPAAA